MVYFNVKTIKLLITSPLILFALGVTCLLVSNTSLSTSVFPPMVHVTHGEYLIDQKSYPATRPNEFVQDDLLSGLWQPTDLPTVFRQAKPKPVTPKTIWVRVRLNDYANYQGPLNLFLVRWIMPGQLSIYADGHLIYHSQGTPMWNFNYRPSVLIPLVRSADGVPPRTLLIRLDWLAGRSAGLSSLYIGQPQVVDHKANLDNLIIKQIPFMMSIALFAIGIVGLGIWYVHRLYPGHLILINSMFGIVWRWHLFFGADVPMLPDRWFIWVISNAALWGAITSHFLLHKLHNMKQRWVNRIILAGGVIVSSLSLPLNQPSLIEIARGYSNMYLGISALLLFIAVFGSWQAWRSHSTNARIVAITMIIGWGGILFDLVKMFTLKNLETLYYSTYSVRLFLIVYIYLMIQHYIQLLRENQNANTVLKQRLHEKESELTQNHERLREIEKGQILSTERQRLMQDMHDGLGSSLTSALHMIEHLNADLPELKSIIRKCINDLKLTVDSLEPLDGDLLLLLATFRYRLGQQLQSAGINIVWEVTNIPKLNWLDPHNAMHILRILQEALSNVLQHANATQVRIATHANENTVSISITDNGKGFDIQATQNHGGHGLCNQKRRAEEIGAQIHWYSSKSGTRLELSLPRYINQH